MKWLLRVLSVLLIAVAPVLGAWAQTISTVAGNGTLGFSGDGGPATSASLNGTYGVEVDTGGNLYIADLGNARVRRVTPDGQISTVAGNGTPGFSGDGGLATSASFNYPYSVAVDTGGNIFIADLNNYRVRKFTPGGLISTVAGDGTLGFSGDGGPATSASLNGTYGVAVDTAGNLYIAETIRVRKVTPDGLISTVAGNGTIGFSGDGGPATSASFNALNGIAVDAGGNLYIGDFGNDRVRKVTPGGQISTVAGNGTRGFSGDGGSATNASLNVPVGVAVDVSGNLYIAEYLNHRIRKVTPGGLISTVAGNGTLGFSGDGGPATSASLANPYDVAVDAGGNIFIADLGNARIRKVSGVAPPLVPTLSIDNVSLPEGNVGVKAFDFTVTLSVPSASTVTVNYATADNTAIAGSDYTTTSGVLTFSPGITTQSITVNVIGDATVEPNERFFVNLSSPSGATLATSQGTGTIVNDDSAPPLAPQITMVSPSTGPAGTEVILYGTNFGATQGTSVVKFDSTPAAIKSNSWGDANIVAIAPTGLSGTVTITVTTAAGTSGGVTFTFSVPPQITNISPTTGPVGGPIIITGSDFGAAQGSSTVQICGLTPIVAHWDDTTIAITVPQISAGTVCNIRITTSIGSSPPITFTVVALASLAGTVTDGSGAPLKATQIRLTGPLNEIVQVNNKGQYEANKLPAGTYTLEPVLQGYKFFPDTQFGDLNGQNITGVDFIGNPLPVIDNLSEKQGYVNDQVKITGSNFGALGNVLFGSAVAPIVSWGDGVIIVTVPPMTGPPSVAVQVVTAIGTSNKVSFSYRLRRVVSLYTNGDFNAILSVDHPPSEVTLNSVTQEVELENVTPTWYFVTLNPDAGVTGFITPQTFLLGPRAKKSLGDLTFPKGTSLKVVADNRIDFPCAPGASCTRQTQAMIGALGLDLFLRVVAGIPLPTDKVGLTDDVIGAFSILYGFYSDGRDLLDGNLGASLNMVHDAISLAANPQILALVLQNSTMTITELSKVGAGLSFAVEFARLALASEVLIEYALYDHHSALTFTAK